MPAVRYISSFIFMCARNAENKKLSKIMSRVRSLWIGETRERERISEKYEDPFKIERLPKALFITREDQRYAPLFYFPPSRRQRRGLFPFYQVLSCVNVVKAKRGGKRIPKNTWQSGSRAIFNRSLLQTFFFLVPRIFLFSKNLILVLHFFIFDLILIFKISFSPAMVPVQIGVVAQGARAGAFGRTFIRINGETNSGQRN